MTTTYNDGDVLYTFKSISPAFTVRVGRFNSQFGYTESDMDSAVQAFTDSLNSTGNTHIDEVNKIFEASGISDWTYTPS